MCIYLNLMILIKIIRGFISTLQQFLCQRQARGEIPTHCDVTHLAEFLNCIIQGMSISAREGASLEKLMQIARTTLRLWPELVK